MFDLFVADDSQLVAVQLGLDRFWLIANTVDDNAVLLWHLWHQWQWLEEVGFVEPFQIAADHMVQLIERVEQVECRRTEVGRLEPLVHVER